MPLSRPPLFVERHSRPGLGKTLDTINAYGARVLFVLPSGEGELRPAASRLNKTGVRPQDIRKKVLPPNAGFHALREFLAKLAPRLPSSDVEALCIDPFSLLVQNEYNRMKARNDTAKQNGQELPVAEGFGGLERELGKRIYPLLDQLQALGVDIILNDHENNGFRVIDGKEKLGGPKYPGSYAVQAVFERADLFARCAYVEVEQTVTAQAAEDLALTGNTTRRERAIVADDQDPCWWAKSRFDFPDGKTHLLMDPDQRYATPHGGGLRYLVKTWEDQCR